MGWLNIKNYQYKPNAPLVNRDSGVPMRDGIDLILALYNRTGAGNGSPNQVAQDLFAAAGDALANAPILAFDWNEVSPVNAGEGVALPVAMLIPGADIVVFNSGANTLRIYPPALDIQIDALGLGIPYQLASGSQRKFSCWSPILLRSAAS